MSEGSSLVDDLNKNTETLKEYKAELTRRKQEYDRKVERYRRNALSHCGDKNRPATRKAT